MGSSPEFFRLLYAIAKIAFITSRRTTASLSYPQFNLWFILSIISSIDLFIAQLVRASHRHREVKGPNHVETLNFSGFFTQLLRFITARIAIQCDSFHVSLRTSFLFFLWSIIRRTIMASVVCIPHWAPVHLTIVRINMKTLRYWNIPCINSTLLLWGRSQPLSDEIMRVSISSPCSRTVSLVSVFIFSFLRLFSG